MRNTNGFKGMLAAALALSLMLAACSNDSGTNGRNDPGSLPPGTNAVGNADAGNGNAAAGNGTSGQGAASPNEAELTAPEDEEHRWEGAWQIKDAGESRGSLITIQAPRGGRVVFMLDAYYLGNPEDENAAPNIGNISNGEAVIQGDTATFTDESLGFTLTMKRAGDELIVASTQGTGYFGQGVYVDGTYERAAASNE